jgi:glutamine---fructose-6-phosphate transaminase (isomerizing)
LAARVTQKEQLHAKDPMCGIVGHVGAGAAAGVIEGLQNLEYRGYDSWGLALHRDDGIEVAKQVGSISRAAAAERFADLSESALVLGHTRWATHGGVTRANAHPHVSFDGRVALVHNGVIENHVELRRWLMAEGVEFSSGTDTEVAAHLVALELSRDGDDPVEAIGRALRRLDGEYALGIVLAEQPDTLYGARQKSPLLTAWNDEGAVLTSDPMAVGGVSEELLYLQDGDIFAVRAGGADVRESGGQNGLRRIARDTIHTPRGQARPGKDGFEHYMIKEIHEVPEAVRVATQKSAEELRGVTGGRTDQLTLIGSGSAFYVARIGQYFLSRLAHLRSHALPSDEAPYWMHFDDKEAVIAISQSGETFDALEVARAVRAGGGHLTSLTNVPNSTLERISDYRLQQDCGPEICVLSTKSVVSQVVLLARVALRLGADAGRISAEELEAHEDSLRRLPETLERLIAERSDEIRILGEGYSTTEHWFFIGRGPLYPAALESALKFKEVSYHHAEGLPAGFFKHGTISLIDEHFFTVALLPSRQGTDDRFPATLANISEIAARNGPVIGFGPEDFDDDGELFADYVPLPFHGEEIADVVIQLVVGQLFAYHCANALGREIDQPRSLAKSVTVR